MKIVFLAPFGIRPKGTVIARMIPLAVELQKLGHTVAIVAPPYTNPEDSGKTETVRGVRLVNVVLPAGGKVRAALPLSWRLFRAVLAEKPDLVHLFKPKGYGGLAGMLLLGLQTAGLRLPPLVLDTDDWEGKGGMNDLQDYSSVEKRLYAFQERFLSLRASAVTVASRELERLTLSMGVEPERILYLPNCVEETAPGDGAGIRERFGISSAVPVVLLYTRFFEFGQDRLHRLFSGIFARVPGVRFLIVGKGRKGEEEQLLSAGRDMGFAGSLVMAGWVEPAELPDFLAAADVAVYPLDDTLVNRAKCPAKLTEIVRAGLPVVADRVGQAAEYLAAADAELLCPVGDRETMANAVVKILSDRDRGQELGKECRNYLLDHFSWQAYAIRLDTLYREQIRR